MSTMLSTSPGMRSSEQRINRGSSFTRGGSFMNPRARDIPRPPPSQDRTSGSLTASNNDRSMSSLGSSVGTMDRFVPKQRITGFNVPSSGSSPTKASAAILERPPVVVEEDESNLYITRNSSPSALPSLLNQQFYSSSGSPFAPTATFIGWDNGPELDIDRQQMRDMFELYTAEHPVFASPLVRQAFSFAEMAHAGQTRRTGDPAVSHCLETARILADLGADEATVAAGLLHDVPSDTRYSRRDMESAGVPYDVLDMVAHVVRMSQLSQLGRASLASLDPQSIDNLKNLFLSAADERPIIVKLADRLHNMRTLHALDAAAQRRFAQETMDVYCPLANRLGLWSLKAEMEDLAFSYLEPEAHRKVAEMVRGIGQTAAVTQALDRVKEALDKAGLKYLELSGRPKSLYGIWRKIQRKGGLDSENVREAIHDARGIRVIVDRKPDCYAALREVERLWGPGRAHKDYIRKPKANGYQSLHAVVSLPDGLPIEVQIRTASMHLVAEYGIASHWKYKEGAKAVNLPSQSPARFMEQRIAWARWIISMEMELDDHKCRPSGSPPDSKKGSLGSISGSPGRDAPLTLALGSASGLAATKPASSLDSRFPAPLSPRRIEMEKPVYVMIVDRPGSVRVREVPRGPSVAPGLVSERLGLAPGSRVLVNNQRVADVSSLSDIISSGDILEVLPSTDWAHLPLVPVPMSDGAALRLEPPIAVAVAVGAAGLTEEEDAEEEERVAAGAARAIPTPTATVEGARRQLDTLFKGPTADSPPR